MEEVIKILTNIGKTIATMESCTGGGLANAITNIPGASEVFKFGAVTYATEYKIKMGVDEKIINKYTVYSQETAEAMAYSIVQFTNASYGIGITGKLKRADIHNNGGEDNIVYFSIYDKDNNKYYNDHIKVTEYTRKENKEVIIARITEMLLTII